MKQPKKAKPQRKTRKIAELNKWIDDKQKLLDGALVGTPTKEVLDTFATSNKGTSDSLLVQMATNFGYQKALNNFKEIL